MHEILDFLRTPAVVTALACLVGVGVGLGHESGSSSALWGSAGAVFVSSVSVAALAPDATLAPTVVVMGYSLTTLLRANQRRGRSRDPSENE